MQTVDCYCWLMYPCQYSAISFGEECCSRSAPGRNWWSVVPWPGNTGSDSSPEQKRREQTTSTASVSLTKANSKYYNYTRATYPVAVAGLTDICPAFVLYSIGTGYLWAMGAIASTAKNVGLSALAPCNHSECSHIVFFQSAPKHTRKCRKLFNMSRVCYLLYVHNLQCFDSYDTVGWVAGRASGL